MILGIVNAPNLLLSQTAIIDSNINSDIKQLNQEIQAKRKQIEQIQEQQQVYQSILKQKQAEKASLDNQMTILENRIAKAELDIDSVEIDIDRTNLEIKKVNLEIAENNQRVAIEKDHLMAVLQLIQKQDDKSTLEILLLNDSLTDFINQVKYLEDINQEIGDSIVILKEYKDQLEKQNEILADKKQNFQQLKQELEDKKITLISEQENKSFIIEQTKLSEKGYQNLLEQAKAEQVQAATEIVSLERAVRAKFAKIQGKELEFNDSGLIWPVAKNVITAYFHDPDYPFRYIFEHPAIDIRSAQNSTIKATASGYVARAKDAGRGYSYIMIVHGDGLASVYGHVSKIFVADDEYVVQGQAIGQSGGLPGTPGAGRLTTGPHLHFEVRLNGIPVNPLEYLP